MARHIPGNIPSRRDVLEEATTIPISFKPKWYFTKDEIDEHSPSRKDGIDREYESKLRHLYCSHLQELGMQLKVPQVTIATAMMLCHRFYMHQSHAKNHWQTIANASMFLACKAEDTPRWLKDRDIIVVAYELMYSWDPLAPQKIKQREIYDRQKELILLGEQLILVTVAFDLNIEHPYKPLVAALKALEITQKEVSKVAWNFVNDWLRTTLCLQYKPHYIAAGSVFLAAKFNKIKLPSSNGKAWWMQFDVSPKQLEVVIQQMLGVLEQGSVNSRAKPVPGKRKPIGSGFSNSSGSTAVLNSSNCSTETASKSAVIVKCSNTQPKYDANDTAQTTENCASESCSANSGVEDCDAEPINGDLDQKSGCKIISVTEKRHKIDISSIKERLKRRKLNRVENAELGDSSKVDEINGDAWIEREIENGIC
ncbi:hypothetical protein ACP275_03G067500 [Erythranthe tilingii]